MPAFPHSFIPNTQVTTHTVANRTNNAYILHAKIRRKKWQLTWNKFLAQLDFEVARFSLLTEDPWASWKK